MSEGEPFSNRLPDSIFNVCEDSLLASPLIIDLALVTEMMTRITWKHGTDAEYKNFHPVLSILSFMLKVNLTQAIRHRSFVIIVIC